MQKENKQKKIEKSREPADELMLLQKTLNSISNSLATVDMAGKILFANQSFLDMFGYKIEEVISAEIDLFLAHENNPEFFAAILDSSLKKGWQGEVLCRHKNGCEINVFLTTSLLRDEFQKPAAIVFYAKNITDELIKRESLKHVEESYRRLFIELKDTVFESTPDGHLIDINPAGLDLFGYNSIAELKRADISRDLYANPADRDKFIKELEKKGYVKNHEIKYKKPDGEIGTLLESAFAVKDENGRTLSYRGVLRDITDLKEVEIELKKMNAAKDKFFSIIAHDLRSPFGSLLSFSEFLVEDLEELTPEEIKLFAEKINESSKAVFKLLDDLLQWSRIQTGRMEYVPADFRLFSLVSQNINILLDTAEAKQISLHNNISKLLTAFVDENMINSIVQNLISNAIKFTKPGGSVTLSSKSIGNMIEVSVADTGIGINDNDIKDLFNIDVHLTRPGTANEEGTGLGLILCKEMVNINGGDISVTSSLGKGSTFKFTIPAAK